MKNDYLRIIESMIWIGVVLLNLKNFDGRTILIGLMALALLLKNYHLSTLEKGGLNDI